MKYKIIACDVFKHEIEYVAKSSPHTLELKFFELGEHAHPNDLRKKLQSEIDASSGFDAVLLCYGLCGRATDGLTARDIPLVIPRSHDCCGILLGSRKRFEDIFKPMPSTPFSSVGFVEHGDYYFNDGEIVHGDGYAALVEQYGEEDAKYIYDAMHPKLNDELMPIYFITSPGIECTDARSKCIGKAASEKREFKELDGNLRLIEMLLSGTWNEDEFLIVTPGRTIRQTGDWDKIVDSK